MTTHPHPPGTCFCPACRARAQRLAPTLFGFLGRRPNDGTSLPSVYAWCPWCANWHIHGDHHNLPGDVLHRYPHCSANNSPYQTYGYLVPVTNVPLAEVYRAMKRTTFEQREIIRDGRTTPAIERLRAQALPVYDLRHAGGRS